MHALGVEQLRPAYKLIRGADLIRNREAARKFAYGLEPVDRESFLIAVAEYLGQRLEAAERKQTSAQVARFTSRKTPHSNEISRDYY